MKSIFTRRRLLIGSAASLASVGLTGCDALTESRYVQQVLAMAERLTMGSQRLIVSPQALAREYTEAEISPSFHPNGSTEPNSAEYVEMVETKFANWRLKIDGMVDRPMEFSLADLKKLPSRTQITRHDCVEGWSAIGKMAGRTSWS